MQNLLLFGDSLFNGYRNGRDTDLITNGLQNKLGTNIHVTNFSQSGATTADGLKRLKLVDDAFDLVILEFGTNDAASWGLSCTSYANNLEKMVNVIGANRLLLVGPAYPNPDNKTIMQYYTPAGLTRYNASAQKIALEHQIPFIDLIANFRKLTQISSYYQADGQHFTDKGNAVLINLLKAAINRKLVQ